MQVTTELREMFSYSIIPIIILLFLLIIVLLLNKFKLKKKAKIIIIEPNKNNKIKIKEKYLNIICELINDIHNNKVSNRHAYQKLSVIIRNFIFEMTQVKVQYYTLSDIDKNKMPTLYELVSEYYDPEFSIISEGNIISSIDKTSEVIKKWS